MNKTQLFVQLPVGFDECDELLKVSESVQLAYVKILCFCKYHLTDGFISDAQLRLLRISKPKQAATKLVDVGLLSRCENGFNVEGPLVDSTQAITPRKIFLGHGKNKGPLNEVKKLLDEFKMPYGVAVEEANLARPIPAKVKDVIDSCSSAILIFTKDELMFDKDHNEKWRPSENVTYELGAASYAYDGRIVILKEKGIDFPTNFESVGYIEFDANGIASKSVEILKELIGFDLLKVTPA